MVKTPSFRNRLRQRLQSPWVVRGLIITNLLTLLALGILLWVHYTTILVNWDITKSFSETFKNVSDALKSVGEFIGIGVAGVWTYYRFIRGRVFSPRLEISVSGRITFVNDQTILIAVGRM